MRERQPVFAEKYLKSKLESFNHSDYINFRKTEKIKSWINQIDRGIIQKATEESLQTDFLNTFFGDILDYDYDRGLETYHLEKENKSVIDATKADGSLGFFSYKGNELIKDVRAVIELKDAKTDLDKPQNRQNDKRSPVEQAFSYASKVGGKCNWVIVSNFIEIRLYNAKDQGKYESFNISRLTDDDVLKKFFFLMHRERLISETGESFTDELYRKRQAEEQTISKKFYQEYKQVRLSLFSHLRENNPDIDEMLLFNKAQKLLDRFIFVCFCEDVGLIPNYTFRKIIQATKNSFDFSDTKLWNQLRGLFHSIDKGNPPMDINRFNGGLFADDSILDSLVIKDEILEKIIGLSEYDFDSDLNVNILGHIFEQSISDIEEIKASIRGEDYEKKQGKRKKEGIYYTPEYITKYIVKEAVGGWLEDRKKELGFDNLPELAEEDYESIRFVKSKKRFEGNKNIERQLEFWEAYREKLSNIKVLDPACGSGAFLVQVFDFLYKEGQTVNSEMARLQGGQTTAFDLDKHILQNNIYGVDLNRESVEITKLSLWLKTANKHKELTALDSNIQQGNSLIDDEEVAGEDAFKWEERFPEIMERKISGFHHITFETKYSRMNSVKKSDEYNGEFEILTEEMRTEFAEILKRITKDMKFKVLACAVLPDHVHMVIADMGVEIGTIVKKIKGVSALELNRRFKSSVQGEGYQHSLWAKGFNNSFLDDERHLFNAIEYVNNNYLKHQEKWGLADNKEANKILNEFITEFKSWDDFNYNSGGFDVVVGNPPYVNFSNLPENLRSYFKKHFTVYKNKTDLFAFFIERNTNLLNQFSFMSMIVPHTWLTTISFEPLRNLFLKNHHLYKIVELGFGVFTDAIVKPIIFLSKSIGNKNIEIYSSDFSIRTAIPKKIIESDDQNKINLDWSPEKQGIIDKIFNGSERLGEILSFTRGIKTSNDKRFLCFEKKNGEYFKVIRGRNIKAYRIDFEGEYIWYRPDLMKQKVGSLPHSKELFETKEKLITQRVNSSGQLLVAYDYDQFYCLDTTNVSVFNAKNINLKLKFILALLNSKLLNWWFNDTFKLPTISGYELKQIPLKVINIERQQPFIEKADIMLDKNKELQEIKNDFTRYIESIYNPKTINQKLSNWEDLEFKDFLKELKKQKVSLPASEEFELMKLFEAEKQKALEVKRIIDETDKQIDQMVYDLYGLTEEEIKIVEGG